MRRRFLLSIASLVTLTATTPKGVRAAEQAVCYLNGSVCWSGTDCCSKICYFPGNGSACYCVAA